jgi:hypothetical protein
VEESFIVILKSVDGKDTFAVTKEINKEESEEISRDYVKTVGGMSIIYKRYCMIVKEEPKLNVKYEGVDE